MQGQGIYMQKTAFLTGKYFISSNSQNGFCGFFESVFSPHLLDKLYIIHGGSGTGKSSMMRKIKSELSGDVLKQEIYCSSDGESLDGVLFHKNGRTVGIVDGTPPHARISILPGLRDEEWNFAHYLEKEGLKKEEADILRLQGQKKEAYRCAYASLSPMGACHQEALKRYGQRFLFEKATASVKRILKKYSHTASADYETHFRFIRAFSMRGEFLLKNWWPEGSTFITVAGNEYSAELYLCALRSQAIAYQLPFVALLSPLSEENLDGIYFPSLSAIFIKEAYAPPLSPLQSINTLRFLEKTKGEEKARMRRLTQIEAALKESAVSSLLEAGKLHFTLEQLHAKNMNFTLLAKEAEEKRDEILSLLS
ncbi:MAG: hypothetical protein J6K61_01730 [Clostridia bacterium]|nr:hypothetical protein [Clostridia bacterium]